MTGVLQMLHGAGRDVNSLPGAHRRGLLVNGEHTLPCQEDEDFRTLPQAVRA